MRQPQNIGDIAALNPDYMGFIFYPPSPRFCSGSLPTLPDTIQKVGVFVNASLQYIEEKINSYQLNALQLHGDESAAFCQQLKEAYPQLAIIKAFAIGNKAHFEPLAPYLSVSDYFLFDTKGANYGGNGTAFNWDLLSNYPYEQPIFLSGGIGLSEIQPIKALLSTKIPIFALDINSKFETSPGEKEVARVREFIKHFQ